MDTVNKRILYLFFLLALSTSFIYVFSKPSFVDKDYYYLVQFSLDKSLIKFISSILFVLFPLFVFLILTYFYKIDEDQAILNSILFMFSPILVRILFHIYPFFSFNFSLNNISLVGFPLAFSVISLITKFNLPAFLSVLVAPFYPLLSLFLSIFSLKNVEEINKKEAYLLVFLSVFLISLDKIIFSLSLSILSLILIYLACQIFGKKIYQYIYLILFVIAFFNAVYYSDIQQSLLPSEIEAYNFIKYNNIQDVCVFDFKNAFEYYVGKPPYICGKEDLLSNKSINNYLISIRVMDKLFNESPFYFWLIGVKDNIAFFANSRYILKATYFGNKLAMSPINEIDTKDGSSYILSYIDVKPINEDIFDKYNRVFVIKNMMNSNLYKGLFLDNKLFYKNGTWVV